MVSLKLPTLESLFGKPVAPPLAEEDTDEDEGDSEVDDFLAEQIASFK